MPDLAITDVALSDIAYLALGLVGFAALAAYARLAAKG